MSTKERIIKGAVELFNQKGYAQVTIKELAQQLKISPGNLTYHFPHRNDLVKAIYKVMEDEMQKMVSVSWDLSLADLQDQLRGYLEFQRRYRFFYADISDFFRDFPDIQCSFQEFAVRNQKETLAIFHYFVGKGLLVPEGNPAGYARLVESLWTLLNFWGAQRRLTEGFEADPEFDTALEMVWMGIIPYLTKQGKHEFEKLKIFT